MAELVKSKNGVQAIDVNEAIKFIFTESGYGDAYEAGTVVSTFSLNESVTEEGDMVTTIINELFYEGEFVAEAVDEVEEEEEVEAEEQDTEEEVSEEEVAQGMTAKELMKAFKDIEDLISDPQVGDE
jgi:hypothetical protein